MKIDIFPHILTDKYKETLYKKLGSRAKSFYRDDLEGTPPLSNLDERFRIMDKYDEYVQIINMVSPSLESVVEPKEAVELAKLANDEMAELVAKYPDRFVAAVACLPMNDMDAALKEVDRAIKDLRFRGVQIFVPINDKSPGLPEFMPLYEKMAQYDLPILMHPLREADVPDYRTEKRSKYFIHSIFGWPYETTVAMAHLVFSGVFDKYPNLKFITHHCGAMVPYLEQRITQLYHYFDVRLKTKELPMLTKRPVDYFRMFYNDTAIYGSTPGLMCGYAFFGADRILFGTDMPFDPQCGDLYIRQTIKSVEQMDIPDLDKEKIFADNARKLFRLSV